MPSIEDGRGFATTGRNTLDAFGADMAMRNINDLMNTYRECSRNLWNVYFSRGADIGASLDVFEQIRRLLFDSLVLDDLYARSSAEGEVLPILKVVPSRRAPILIRRLNGESQTGYWDQEKDMTVSADDISLEFVDYFDFSQVPLKDYQYYRCKIISFATHANYEGLEALVEVSSADVFQE
jgi:hypothetical protein